MTERAETGISERLLQPATQRVFLFVMLPCLAYAGVRYHIAEAVPLTHAPLFILNKAVSLGGLAFLALSYLVGKVGPLRWEPRGEGCDGRAENITDECAIIVNKTDQRASACGRAAVAPLGNAEVLARLDHNVGQ